MANPRHPLLVLSHDYRSINIDEALAALRDETGARVVRLSRRQVRWLPLTLRLLGAHRYPKVLLDLPFKHIHERPGALRRLSRLHIYEEDACQDHLPHSKWHGRFSAFYRAVRPEKVIVTGHITARHFQQRGIDAAFVAKGYSGANTGLLDLPRDIEVGFIGRLRSSAYQGRAALLGEAERVLGCRLLRTRSSDEYKTTLNRIRFFLSADKGLDEYMAKNFEAMACGCILVAFRQGRGEEAALGLEDMHNCVLYESLKEAHAKIQALRHNPARMAHLQARSLQLAPFFSHPRMGRRIAALL